jgi:hypothetical protein
MKMIPSAPNPRLQRTPLRAPLSRKPLGDGRLRSVFIPGLLLIVSTLSCTTTVRDPAGPKDSVASSTTVRDRATSSPLDSVVGLWQFPDRWVWIKILPDGRAFQCRIDPVGEVFRSEGIVTSDGKINWRENWGTEIVTRIGEGITLTGKRRIRYIRSKTEMKPACNAPF